MDEARFYAHARRSAMEAAASLDTMRVMKLIAETSYARGIELLEGIVAMLTKMTWKIHVQGGVRVQVHVNVKVNGTVLI